MKNISIHTKKCRHEKTTRSQQNRKNKTRDKIKVLVLRNRSSVSYIRSSDCGGSSNSVAKSGLTSPVTLQLQFDLTSLNSYLRVPTNNQEAQAAVVVSLSFVQLRISCRRLIHVIPLVLHSLLHPFLFNFYIVYQHQYSCWALNT